MTVRKKSVIIKKYHLARKYPQSNTGELMEKNKGSRQQKSKKRSRQIFDFIITKLIVAVFIIGCFISMISTQSTMKEKREELAEIQAAIDEVKTENVELERILESDDINAYMEKQAIEELNYAYPNEQRFYDTSRD